MATLTASAGSDASTTTGSVPLLTASYTVGPNPLVSMVWTQVSGPDCILSNPTGAITPVYELSNGTYTFQFTVKDNQNNVVSDQMVLTVTSSGGPVYLPKTEYPYNFN